MWNYRFSLTLAKAIKEKYPKCIIICGEPSVPWDAIPFLKENSFIDITCRGEGELIFSELLLELLLHDEYEKCDFSKIGGISYVMNGKITVNERNHSLMNLTKYISSYLSGEFDYLFNEKIMNTSIKLY